MKKSQFSLFLLDRQHRIEALALAPYACKSQGADRTRIHPEAPHPYRKSFSRDRDRIIHSRAFRRLKHKRQVFLTNVGDHYRTRLTHTMEVSQLSRTIARALGLNEDLTEAIALGHDLGHTPFGHLGEAILDLILRGKFSDRPGFPHGDAGGFKHNYQSLRVVDELEFRYEFAGLNLTAPVREGILKHTRLKRNRIHYPNLHTANLNFEHDVALTLEGQVVAIADEIAQRTHDLEDGMRAGLVETDEVRKLELVLKIEEELKLKPLLQKSDYLYRNRLIHGLINFLVSDVIDVAIDEIARFYEEEKRFEQFDREILHFGEGVDPLQKQLNKFIYERIIWREEVRKFDDPAREVILYLYQAYNDNPELLPDVVQQGIARAEDDGLRARIICDHIAGMTDPFAVSELKRLQDEGYLKPNFDIDALQLDWMR
ncbi:MAG: dNTP triphosphohydrolase [candidate division KSB1 bacterium]|nr:dNTP triphosphohydrolase [candidate division KSB1 bacterium]MDQ7064753.1 dNTP triphosphohydrolase [candidate division KSB1 bacterium]